jgi:glycosyltransferase involved in cell wall biosynthesis
MRIVFVNPYGAGTTYSGPTVFLSRLLEPVSRRHHTAVLLGARNEQDTALPGAATSVPIMTFQRYSPWEQLRWSVRVTRWLLRHADEYDVVHIHGASLFNLLPAAAASARRRRYLLVPLGARADLSLASRSSRIPLITALRRRLVSGATLGLALSDDIAEEFAALGLPRQRIVAIRNPVDTERFAPPAPPEEDPRADRPVLGFVGKLCERKQPHVVLDALAWVRQRGFPNARAVFVGPFGDPGYERFFRDRMAELGLAGAVDLVGYRADVSVQLARDMSVFLLPSKQEGLPGALIEAMASGLPAIVTDVGAMGRVVREAGCGWVLPADPAAIGPALTELWRDRRRWIELSTAARRYAQAHCDIDVVAHIYMGALDKAGDR